MSDLREAWKFATEIFQDLDNQSREYLKEIQKAQINEDPEAERLAYEFWEFFDDERNKAYKEIIDAIRARDTQKLTTLRNYLRHEAVLSRIREHKRLI